MTAVVAKTNEDLAILYSIKKQILSTYEKNNFDSIFVCNSGC
jgi:hypothetical protein